MTKAPTPVVTCTIRHKDKFLVIRRHDKAKKFGGVWGFPGGKVEVGETIVGAIRREVEEETRLELEDTFLFVDSYYYGDSVGLHFDVTAKSSSVTCETGVEHKWLKSLAELQKLPRIPGIDFHLKQADKLRKNNSPHLSLSDVDYTPDKYIN